jgi:predicted outer membrane repeat protein
LDSEFWISEQKSIKREVRVNMKTILKSGAGHATIVLFIFFSVILSASSSWAATHFVANLNDSGDGSLRYAVSSASAGDTIKFGVTGTITLTSGKIDINKDLAIIGPGAPVLAISGNNASQIFNVFTGKKLDISGLTIRNGTDLVGGAILNFGNLKIADCEFIDNTATSIGGAIYADQGGSTVISRTTFSNNSAANGGGAILTSAGALTIIDCTFSGNDANYGGAIATAHEGSLIIRNSTFYNNTAESGGAIAANDDRNTVTLLNSTFSDNNSPSGSALYIHPGVTVNATNTIFANSTLGANCNNAITGINSYNLDFGGPSPLNNCGAGNTGDPKFFGFYYYGGETATMPILFDSAAYNAGSPVNFPSTDQRGWPRPYGVAPDIGAYEVQPSAGLTLHRSGSGTVKSFPAGIFCPSGCSLDGSAFPYERSVSLYTIPDPGNHIFSGWSGEGCGSTVLMTADRTCTAAFTSCVSSNPVEGLSSIQYSSIMAGYGGSAHQNQQLKVTASTRLEDLNLGNTVALTLKGGYNCGWTSQVDYTYIGGHLIVSNGSVILDRIVIL